VNKTCYVQNRIYILLSSIGCTCYILNNKLYLKKLDAKAQRGIFLGYSECSKAYRVYNSKTLCVEESMHVKFDDKEP